MLTSQDLVIRNMVVHDGHACACPTASCFPVFSNGDKLIPFEVALGPSSGRGYDPMSALCACTEAAGASLAPSVIELIS